MIYSSIKVCVIKYINCVIKSCQMTAKSNLEEKHFSSKERIKSITRFGLSECVMISGMVIQCDRSASAISIAEADMSHCI